MALTDENGGTTFTMPVQPMYGNNGGGGFGFGGDWSWILLLILLCGGGWGMGGFGGGFGADGLFPWLNNSQNINGGFRDQMLGSQINGIQSSITSGFGDVQNSLCSGFAGVNASIAGAQSAIAAQMYGNQIADLERSFAAQTANTAGLTALQAQLAQCCCDNRAATADLKFTVATEACADRAAVADALRDVIAANTASTQRILDQLCQDKIDAKNDTIAQLRQELMFARGQASQDVQTAQILAGQVSEIDGVYNRLKNCPVPSVPVYGTNPIFTCGNSGCGCGCSA